MTRITNLPNDKVASCPECEVAGCVNKRVREELDFDHEYACHRCGARFDEYHERQAKGKEIGSGRHADGIPVGLPDHVIETIRKARSEQ